MPVVPGSPKWSGSPVDRQGGGGDDGGMEARVTKLEAIIPALATKEDLARVEGSIRSDMHREFAAQTWRIIGAILTFGSMLAAAVYFIARNVAP